MSHPQGFNGKFLLPKQQVGKDGEETAVHFLQSLGYHIEDRNVRLLHDEIDIIAFDPTDQVVVLVEVKARSGNSGEYVPELNLTWRKKRAMRRAARRWIADHYAEEIGYRLDLVCIVGGLVTDHLIELSWDRPTSGR